MKEEENKPGFKITGGRGFHITFENGITISLQFAGGNYCDNRHEPIIQLNPGFEEFLWCSNAEIAIWNKDAWFNFDTFEFKEGEPLGYVTPEKLVGWIEAAMKNDFSKMRETNEK